MCDFPSTLSIMYSTFLMQKVSNLVHIDIIIHLLLLAHFRSLFKLFIDEINWLFHPDGGKRSERNIPHSFGSDKWYILLKNCALKVTPNIFFDLTLSTAINVVKLLHLNHWNQLEVCRYNLRASARVITIKSTVLLASLMEINMVFNSTSMRLPDNQWHGAVLMLYLCSCVCLLFWYQIEKRNKIRRVKILFSMFKLCLFCIVIAWSENDSHLYICISISASRWLDHNDFKRAGWKHDLVWVRQMFNHFTVSRVQQTERSNSHKGIQTQQNIHFIALYHQSRNRAFRALVISHLNE